MPNWCSNYLTVTGNNPDLLAFKKQASSGKTGILEFNCFVKPEFNTVDGQTAVWGTKWDLDEETILTEDDGQLKYIFSTAWSPPIDAVLEMSLQHPNCSFLIQYSESGSDFIGYHIFENGHIVDVAEKSYHEHTQAQANLETISILDEQNVELIFQYFIVDYDNMFDFSDKTHSYHKIKLSLDEFSSTDFLDQDAVFTILSNSDFLDFNCVSEGCELDEISYNSWQSFCNYFEKNQEAFNKIVSFAKLNNLITQTIEVDDIISSSINKI